MMDEMSTKSTFEYDVGDQLVRGYDTLKPSNDDLTTHALAFALSGVKTRWKQVVAYHFTGSSFNKEDVPLALKEIAILLIRLISHSHITSDMGLCIKGF
uniref:Putative LOC100209634 [Hydra vulgaris] n=1 Tax=Lepeophtheirus salmonis TaxID=72036 RepID=A0A0K2TJU0_LEPSM